MRERPCTFGPEGTTVGVTTEPAPEDKRDGAPWIVLANVGLNHRVGPHRMWVDLARALAAQGYATLRFDLSGLGDSEPRKESIPDVERAVLDLEDALAHLTKKRGAERFVLMGLCSGVDSIHALTLKDRRVAGAVFMDGYTYRTPAFYARHFTTRNLLPERWRRFVRRKWISYMRPPPKGVREPAGIEEIYTREYPSQDRFCRDVDAMVERGVKLLYVFSGEIDNDYNYRDQLYDMLGGKHRGVIDVEHYRRADHVYSFLEDRKVLQQRLVTWVRERFPC